MSALAHGLLRRLYRRDTTLQAIKKLSHRAAPRGDFGVEITFNVGSHDDTPPVSLWLGRSKCGDSTLGRPLTLSPLCKCQEAFRD